MMGYGGTGREKSAGPSGQHAENGDDENDVVLASGLVLGSVLIFTPPTTNCCRIDPERI